MRLTTVILIASLLQVSAAGFAQKITLNQRNTSLEAVLKEIRKQSGYDYYYDSKILSKDQKVSVSVKDATIDQALKEVLNGLPVVYEIEGKTISIKKKESTFLERLADRWASIDVSGRVVDADGRGLPGASVSVKGKGGKAVSTGANGSFYLKGVEEDATLAVSFIGYVSKEVKVAKELGDIMLEVSLSKLDEVQVIAYGTTTQRLSTGNVTTIKADVIEKQPVNNPLLALQGRVPGLFIEQATGFAGTGVKVRIQGQNSLNNGSDPLYIVDGVPYNSQLLSGSYADGSQILGNSGGNTYGNPLSFINPSDIESIDVLKDADATAIYGSRAANGAILITTKKGKAGDTRVSLNLQSGWAKVPRKLDLMNSEQYLEMRREAFVSDGLMVEGGPYGDSDLNGNWDNSRNTDWQKELIGGTAGYQDMNTSISGGNERTTFLIGAGYHRETTVFPGNFEDNKGSLHFNINNASANQKFKVQFSGSYLFDRNLLPNYDLTEPAIRMAPVAPSLYKPNGSINWEPDNAGNSTFLTNPIGIIFNKYLNKTHNLNSNLILDYQIIPGLYFKTSIGYNSLTSNITNKSLLQSVQPEFLQYNTRATIFGNSTNSSWTIEPQLIYSKNIGSGKLEGLLGATVLQNNTDVSYVTAFGFSNDLVMDDIMSAPNVRPSATLNSVYKSNALFARINYNLKDKYIINLTGRRDGSSRFGSQRQFHNFGALGAAWIFSQENIVKDKLSFLSFGKIRGSFGTTGSDQIGEYQFLSLYSPLDQAIAYQGIPAYQPNGLSNPYLEWEETRKLQFGLDLGFLKDRVLFNANYYANYSSNQLSNYSLPLTTGFSGITRNQSYRIKNSGWELMLSATNIHSDNFRWTSSINITLPKTLLVDYPDIVKSSAAFTSIIGEPLTSRRVFKFLGVDPATGAYQFADKNGNPTISPNDPLDKTIIVDLAPSFYGGLQNTLTYKEFQLDFMLTFVKQVAENYGLGVGYPGNFNGGLRNQPETLLGRWKKPGDVSAIQRVTTGYALYQSTEFMKQSDAFWENAAYIRLKNVSLSWKLPSRWCNVMNLRNCNLFIQGQNLWTLTNYSGLDPETKSSSTLPALRVVTIGLKVNL